jgi:hypothetical protein
MDLSPPREPRREADDQAISRLWEAGVAGPLWAVPPEESVGLVGRELELGAPVGTEYWRSYPVLLVLGWILALAAAMGLGIAGLAASGDASTTEALGGLAVAFAAGVVMIAAGTRQRVLRGWLAHYPDGFAQLLATDPGPRAVRWASVEEVTVTFKTTAVYTGQITTTTTYVDSFSAHPFIGGLAPDLGRWRSWRLMMNAQRAAGPRLVAAMIAAYESGQPAAFGSFRFDQSGVTFPGPGAAGPGTTVPWRDVRSIRLRPVSLSHGGPVVGAVVLSCQGNPRTRTIAVSGLPNGLFLPRVIAHAARRQGVPVKGQVI